MRIEYHTAQPTDDGGLRLERARTKIQKFELTSSSFTRFSICSVSSRGGACSRFPSYSDKKGYVNLKAACPMAGANHIITVAELKPATKVINAKRRGQLKRRVATEDDIEDLS